MNSRRNSQFSYALFISEIAQFSGESLEKVRSRVPISQINLSINDLWYIVEFDMVDIGYFWIRLFPETNSAFGYDIFLDKGYRGKGIGRYVMTECRKILREYKIEKMKLCVFIGNMATRRLYESIGFKETEFNAEKRQSKMEVQL